LRGRGKQAKIREHRITSHTRRESVAIIAVSPMPVKRADSTMSPNELRADCRNPPHLGNRLTNDAQRTALGGVACATGRCSPGSDRLGRCEGRSGQFPCPDETASGTGGWLSEETPKRLGKFEFFEQLVAGSFGLPRLLHLHTLPPRVAAGFAGILRFDGCWLPRFRSDLLPAPEHVWQANRSRMARRSS
jgi:hypothetical protein